MTDTAVRPETDTEAARDSPAVVEPLRPWTPRGRHRRPRPRKVLLAAGGLALAAGVLSLVRMVPESGVGGVSTAEAEPSPDPGNDTDRAKKAVATIGSVPEVSPPATSVMGGVSATPTTGFSVVPTPSATAAQSPTTEAWAPAPAATTIPETADTPAPATTPRPHRPATSAAPRPTPGQTADSPAPKPAQPGLCVPIIGLCVNSQTQHR
jgi:hypothetical protein